MVVKAVMLHNYLASGYDVVPGDGYHCAWWSVDFIPTFSRTATRTPDPLDLVVRMRRTSGIILKWSRRHCKAVAAGDFGSNDVRTTFF